MTLLIREDDDAAADDEGAVCECSKYVKQNCRISARISFVIASHFCKIANRNAFEAWNLVSFDCDFLQDISTHPQRFWRFTERQQNLFGLFSRGLVSRGEVLAREFDLFPSDCRRHDDGLLLLVKVFLFVCRDSFSSLFSFLSFFFLSFFLSVVNFFFFFISFFF